MSSLKAQAATLTGMKLQFNELSLRRRLLVSQLPLLISVGVALVITAAVAPPILNSGGFRFAAVLLAALTAACVVVPWERYRPLAY